MQANRETITILIVVTTIIILSLVFAGVLLLYVYSRKSYLYHKRIAAMKAEYEKGLLNTQLEIQEQTLENISREIHDNIGLSLTLSKLKLHTLDLPENLNGQQKILETVELISTAIYDLSSISHSLNSNTVKKNGLIRALEEELDRIRRSCSLKIELNTDGEPLFLDNQKELVLFRISQEALNNALKHSGSSKISVTLSYSKDYLGLTIEDNGIGFDLNKPSLKNGSGISNMSVRASLINATCEITSIPGHGTTVITKAYY